VSYLFDTTVAIDWSVDHPGVREVVEACYAATGDLYTCDVVLCEALSGGSQREREVIRRFLGALEYVAIDPDGAAQAGELRRSASRSGAHSLGDALIAATALRVGATIVTRNPADFERFDVPVIGYGGLPS
jgi:predicted nucleic acid-binding protein